MKKRRMITLAAGALLALSISVPAYAGWWEGSAESGWKWNNGNRTHANSGWAWCDGDGDGIAESYYFDNAGYVLTGPAVSPDGYTVNSLGEWIQDGVIMHKNLATGEVYGGTGAGAAAWGQNLAEHAGSYEGYLLESAEGNREIVGSLSVEGGQVTAVVDGATVFSGAFDLIGQPMDSGKSAVWMAADRSALLGGTRSADGSEVLILSLDNGTQRYWFERWN